VDGGQHQARLGGRLRRPPLRLIGSLIAYQFAPGRTVIAVVMALGTGVLIGSVSYELVDEALKTRTVAGVA
jgi:zinc transporter, ZIP family